MDYNILIGFFFSMVLLVWISYTIGLGAMTAVLLILVSFWIGIYDFIDAFRVLLTLNRLDTFVLINF